MALKRTSEKVWTPHISDCFILTPLHAVGIPVFGPTALAARMEGSKAFSKAFMDRHSIPTAKFTVFPSSDFEGAKQYVNSCGFKVVLKASGLAAGKGVLIPDSVDEAVQGLKEIMVDNVFGAAGTAASSCIQFAVHSIHPSFFSSSAFRCVCF